MKIFVTEPYTFTGDDLIVGEVYEVQPAESGTLKQNAAFHSLLQEYWRTGEHSYNARNFAHFKKIIKRQLGAGVEMYYETIDNDTGELLETPVIKRRIKSWSDYTIKQRKETIDRLISEMLQVGINTPKFNEILQGLENSKMEKVA